MSDETAIQDEEILQVLFQALSRFPTKTGALTAQTSLTADLSLDSVSMMEVLVEVEDHFDIGLPLNRMANVSTIQDLADLIRTNLGTRA